MLQRRKFPEIIENYWICTTCSSWFLTAKTKTQASPEFSFSRRHRSCRAQSATRVTGKFKVSEIINRMRAGELKKPYFIFF